MRVIRELANVDDVMFGAETREALMETKSQVVDTLKSGGMVLRKWASNDPSLLSPSESIPALLDESNSSVKLLGVNWALIDDTLVPIPISLLANTKRKILSEIASLFDPLGFLSPIIIKVKCFMQSLWTNKLGWDDVLPENLQEQWTRIAQDISSWEEFRLERWLHHSSDVKSVELVEFRDASEIAYDAVVYLRIVDREDNSFIQLVMAKSKVAPLKTISIPRLCEAVLLKDLLI